MNRIVVTGMGLVTSLGHSIPETWNAIIASKSGIQQYLNDPILKNDKPFNLALIKEFQYKKWKIAHASSRLTSFLAKATAQALENSQINLKQINLDRAGICLGNLASSTTKLLEYIEQSTGSHYKNVNRLSMLQILTNIPAGALNVLYGFKGPSMTVSTACASGLSALIEGTKWIKMKQADFVIVGASEDVYNPLYLNSSIRIQAMTTKAYEKPEFSSRPFDRDRSGFVLGQGAGILILESLDHAIKRKAPIIAQVTGYGYSSDGFHLVKPEPSGYGQYKSMQMAIKMSQIQPADIDHINVHATSTQVGDLTQIESIQTLFKDKAMKPTISAIKSYIGHTFAAAGAIETIIGLLSMKNAIAPKILNLDNPVIPSLNYCKENNHQQINYMLKNSFGFGGINTSCVFKRFIQ